VIKNPIQGIPRIWKLFVNKFFIIGLIVVHFPDIFYNVIGEPFILKDFYEILKNIFICVKKWASILNKYANEIYERRYTLWIATIIEPIL